MMIHAESPSKITSSPQQLFPCQRNPHSNCFLKNWKGKTAHVRRQPHICTYGNRHIFRSSIVSLFPKERGKKWIYCFPASRYNSRFNRNTKRIHLHLLLLSPLSVGEITPLKEKIRIFGLDVRLVLRNCIYFIALFK